MKRHLVCRLLIVLLASRPAIADEPAFRDIYPDTWVATDALGRTMPDYSVVGPVKEDQRRVVGIFYITWHSDRLAKFSSPVCADVTRVLAADPKRSAGCQTPALDRRHVPLGRAGTGLFPEQGPVCHSQRHVDARRCRSRRSDHGCHQCACVTGTSGSVIFPVMQTDEGRGQQGAGSSASGPSTARRSPSCRSLYDRIYKAGRYKTSGSTGTANRSCSTTARRA